MAHPDHDAVVDAFRRVDPGIVICDRGGAPGYTHIHAGTQALGATRCTTHAVVVEKQNGTVSLRAPLAQQFNGVKRPPLPIAQHPLGYSHRSDYGSFDHGFASRDLSAGWSTLDDFARDVIQAAKVINYW